MLEIESKLIASWDDIKTSVEDIVEKIKDMELPIDSIYGIPRGGLIPAVMLSHKLELPLVFDPTENTLIVDDISDSGITLNKTITTPSKYTATLHMRKGSSYVPTIYSKLIESEKWIVYPWEEFNAKPIQNYKL